MTAPNQRGFVFVEAMVALAIVAVAVGLLFTILGDSLGRSRAVTAKHQGLLVAQSRLAAVGSEIPLRAGQVSGAEGALVWQVGISPYRTGSARSAAGELFLVTVAVRGRNDRAATVELRSLRLAAPG